MMIGIPIIQLTLLRFAINNGPRHLPIAVLLADHSAFARSHRRDARPIIFMCCIIRRSRCYCAVATSSLSWLSRVRGDFPAVLLEIDATDPAALVAGRQRYRCTLD